MEQSKGLEKAVKIRVRSIKDLARMAASSLAFGQPTYILRYDISNGKSVYGILAVFRDYYRLYGIPLFYYYEDGEGAIPKDCNYILVKTDSDGEKIETSKGSKPGYIAIPIINLKEVPEFLMD